MFCSYQIGVCILHSSMYDLLVICNNLILNQCSNFLAFFFLLLLLVININ